MGVLPHSKWCRRCWLLYTTRAKAQMSILFLLRKNKLCVLKILVSWISVMGWCLASEGEICISRTAPYPYKFVADIAERALHYGIPHDKEYVLRGAIQGHTLAQGYAALLYYKAYKATQNSHHLQTARCYANFWKLQEEAYLKHNQQASILVTYFIESGLHIDAPWVTFPPPLEDIFSLSEHSFYGNQMEESIQSLTAACGMDDVRGQLKLGFLYLSGKGVKRSPSGAYTWFSRAADQDNVIGAGELAFLQRDDRSIKYLQWASQKGYAKAQYQWWHVLKTTHGTAPDGCLSCNWLEEAAKGGYALAQYEVGVGHETNTSLPYHLITAIGWYLKAAVQGNRIAQERLETLYLKTSAIAFLSDGPVKWCRMAARLGNREAQQVQNTMEDRDIGTFN